MVKDELRKLLNQPYKSENWKKITEFVFPNVSYLQRPQDIPIDSEFQGIAESFKQLGFVKLNDGKNLALFEVHVTDKVNLSSNRVQLRKLVANKIDKDRNHGVLVIYEQGKEDYRFTFTAKSTEFDELEGDFKDKETDAKRFTYILGKNESCKTAANRFWELSGNKDKATIKDVEQAFSVERLNKEFFEKYKGFYEDFVQHITGKRFEKEKGKWVEKTKGKAIAEHKTVFKSDDKLARNFVKLLLGRLVFIQFLQKKGWMGVPADSKKWKDGDKDFINNLFNSSKNKDKFHSDVLHDLFYKAFNTPNRPNDVFSLTGTRVPYLNGGLFENEYSKTELINFPSSYFQDLFDFFGQYNFTIDENDPMDHEVGIDPEMLGHIFENLLEDNKDKGAFYTPKPIVQYMCQESLIQYLKTYLIEQKLWTNDEKKANKLFEGIQNFVRKKTASAVIDFDEQIATALREVKICDPAIGSGAFPMGLLNEIFYCMNVLYNASPDVVGEIWKMNSWQADIVKKNIIQHSIYGVDLEKGAVDIARLRFWLSLIVDEKEPYPLPNLDFKIMQGNSLLESFEGIDLSNIAGKPTEVNEVALDLFGNPINAQSTIFDTKYIDESNITELIEEYFNAQKPDQKQSLKKEIDNIIHSHINFNLEVEENKIHVKIANLEFKVGANKVNKTDTKGVAEKKEKVYLKLASELKKEKEALKNLQQKRRELHDLQNTSERPYFLWHLFFKDIFDRGGFDIVIGNPPYGAKFNDEDKNLYRKIYPETQFKIDSYSLFILKTFQLLRSQGVCYYIIPNTLLDNYFEEKVREKLLLNFKVNEIVDLHDGVFAEAVVHSMVFSFIREVQQEYQIKLKTNRALYGETKTMPKSYVLSQDKYVFFIRGYENIDILQKLNDGSIFLENIVDVKDGIDTGNNELYVSETQVDKNWKKLIGGKDIDRYNIVSHKYILHGDHLANPRRKEVFEQDKIVVRETGDKIIATYDNSHHYALSTLYSLNLKDQNFDLKYILALLNSKVFHFLMNLIAFEKTKGAFTKTRIFHYYKLPVKNIKKDKQRPFIEIVDKILEAKKNSDDSTKHLEDKLDLLIFKLYGITYEEAKIIDPTLAISEKQYSA
jgi:adenine-specific DNA-methyltransferase